MSSLDHALRSRSLTSRIGSLVRSPVLALTLAALFWSGNFVVGRALRDQIDPMAFNFARWSLALVLFAPFVASRLRAHAPVLLREWRLVLGLGATGIAAFHTLTYLALHTTTATNALLVLSLAPIAILAGAMLVGLERPGPVQFAGMLVSLTGAAVLITRGDVSTIRQASFATGDLLMLLGIGIWAAYSLLLRRRPADLPQDVTLAASAGTALVLLAPVVILGSTTPLAAFTSPRVLAGIGYTAVFASLIAFLCWSYGVARLGASRAGQFIHLMPVFGAALAIVTLGETLALAQAAGAALVLAGIVLVERRAARPR